MPDEPKPPLSPWTMTPARLTILALGVLALLMIVGGIFGGVANFAILQQANTDASASSSAP